VADGLMGADPGPSCDVDARARRRSTWLTVGSVACGVAAFVVAIVISQLLVPPDGGSVEIGAAVLTGGVVFGVLIALCIVLGYVGARTRPPRRD
jgi:hypothetical protein